jgi:hypothetical protein
VNDRCDFLWFAGAFHGNLVRHIAHLLLGQLLKDLCLSYGRADSIYAYPLGRDFLPESIL